MRKYTNNLRNNTDHNRHVRAQPKFINSTTEITWTRRYRTDEKILRDILKKNIACNNDHGQIQLSIYYQNRKTSQLLMKNNFISTKPSNRTNVIYKFTCPHEDCRPRNNFYNLHWRDYDDFVETIDHAPSGEHRTSRALVGHTQRKTLTQTPQRQHWHRHQQRPLSPVHPRTPTSHWRSRVYDPIWMCRVEGMMCVFLCFVFVFVFCVFCKPTNRAHVRMS